MLPMNYSVAVSLDVFGNAPGKLQKQLYLLHNQYNRKVR